MLGYRFTKYDPLIEKQKSSFDSLLKIFLQLLTISSGDVSEALNWMNELDRKYNLSDDQYGIGDFIDDLKKNNYIEQDATGVNYKPTSKSERTIRKQSLEEIFGKLKRSMKGSHRTFISGQGDEPTSERRQYLFGDLMEQIDMTDSIKNAQINHGIDDFNLTERDLEVEERDYKTNHINCSDDRYFSFYDTLWRR